jgi:hypothetical protein
LNDYNVEMTLGIKFTDTDIACYISSAAMKYSPKLVPYLVTEIQPKTLQRHTDFFGDAQRSLEGAGLAIDLAIRYISSSLDR